jgi:hypothetical protein
MLLPHLLEVVELTPIFLICLLLVDWPVLKGHVTIKVSNWLVKKHHDCLYREAA